MTSWVPDIREVEIRSGAEVSSGEAFQRWEAHMSETYFPLAVSPTDSIFTRRQVLAYLRRRFTDPDLTMDEVAHACLVSRRTLYRVCAGFGGPAALVRRMRIEHARKLLRADPSRPLSAIAFASGFGTERHFYRAFRDETGMTPGEFRTGLGPDS